MFGPTASGKSAVAEALADRLGTEVVSADAMQVYRGLPLLTNQSERPTRLVAIRALAEEMSVGEFAALAHEAIDELVSTRADGRRRRRYRSLPPRGARRARAPTPSRSRGRESAGRRRTTSTRRAPTRRSPPVTRPRRASSIRTTGDASSARWSWQRPDDRLPRTATACGQGRRDGPRSSPAWTCRPRPSSAGSRSGRARCSDVGSSRRCGEPVQGSSRQTAEKALGLREIEELSPDEACQRLLVRTRRYAAYQRKWMRRIPGIVMIEADRPADEVADAILEVARAR